MATQIDIDAKVLTEDRQGWGHPHIVTLDGTGKMLAVQMNDSNVLEVHLFNGTGWFMETSYSDSGISRWGLMRDELGNVYLMYQIGATGSVTVKVKKRTTAAVWSEVLSESITAYAGFNPMSCLRFSGFNNRLYLLWILKDVSLNFFMKFKYTDDHGGSWTAASYTLSGPGSATPVYFYNVDVSATDGSVYCVYDGGNWGSNSILKFDAACIYISTTNITMPSGGNDNIYGGAFAVYGTTRWTIQYSYFPTTWYLTVWNAGSVSLAIYSGASDNYYYGSIALGVDSSGNVFVFYVKRSNNKAYYRKYTGSWGSETAMSSNEGYRINCELHSFTALNKISMVYYATV